MSTMGDLGPTELVKGVDALNAVRQHRGNDRTKYLINRIVDELGREAFYVSRSVTTGYCNAIAAEREKKSSGDHAVERGATPKLARLLSGDRPTYPSDKGLS